MSKSDITITAVFAAIGALFVVFAVSAESVVWQWIWGIIAVAVLAFTVYGTVEAIVKNKKKKEAINAILAEAFESPDFERRMEEKAQRRDVLYDGQKPTQEDYGYSPTNPIMTSSISGSDRYLQKLRTMNGEAFTWVRLGSHCMTISGVEHVMVDEYQLWLNGNIYAVIYICPYGHQGSFVPKGLSLQE